MGTKSKRYSRAGFWKTLAFLVVCLTVGGVVQQSLQIYYYVNQAPIPITFDVITQSDYTQSEAFLYADYYTAASTLQSILTATSVSERQREKLDYRIVYYINDGNGFEAYNTDYREIDQFAAFSPFHYLYEQGGYQRFSGNASRYVSYESSSQGAEPTVYFAFDPQYISQRRGEWTEAHTYIETTLYFLLANAGAALLLTIYLTFVTGRRRQDDEIHLCAFDRLYSDLMLLIQMGVLAAGMGALAYLTNGFNTSVSQSPETVIQLATLISVVVAACLLATYLSFTRKIKAGRLLRHSLIWAVFSGIFRMIRGFFRGIFSMVDMLFIGRRFGEDPFARAMFRRQANYLLTSIAIIFFFTLFALAAEIAGMLCMAIIEMVVTVHYVRANNNTFEDMERICAQVYEVYQGNMDFNPRLQEGTQLYAASRQLLDVGEGMTRSMERQLASERTKIALVTNVSHDLKTPLTSIIGYIDLLAQDETLSPEARDYVTILNNKSQRLKSIIQDLFDLAKSTGGDDNLHPEVLELRRLIEQTLAEMEDKIIQSGHAVKTALPEDAVYTYADGRKLYRVIQNVVDNALKYSMAGTRIFITLSHSETHGRIDFKNTASYEMNFTAAEILERFARGDEARTSEGSGLGLNIAESFTRACGGEMKVRVDGDQFKLSLIFPISPPPGELPQPEPVAHSVAQPVTLRPESAQEGRKKIYQPRTDTPPQPLKPGNDGHFEPEKPVEIAELESVLEAFEEERSRTVQKKPPRKEKKEVRRPAGKKARDRLERLGAETGEAIEQLRSMLDLPGRGRQKDYVKEAKGKRPKAFDKFSMTRQADIIEPEFEALPTDDLPDFILQFHELKAEEQARSHDKN